jgi:hypothetical protein
MPKRGDIDPTTGRVFWARRGVKEGRREIWLRDVSAYEDRKAKHAGLCKAWVDRNPEQRRAIDRRFQARATACNPSYRLGRRMRIRVNAVLRRENYHRTGSSGDYLGCSLAELKAHLEARFLPGMTWANYGSGWHVDHIVPLASAKTPDEILRLCHYTNLQPLWAQDNLRKGAKCLT